MSKLLKIINVNGFWGNRLAHLSMAKFFRMSIYFQIRQIKVPYSDRIVNSHTDVHTFLLKAGMEALQSLTSYADFG